MNPVIQYDDLAGKGGSESRYQFAHNSVDMVFMLLQCWHGVQWSYIATLDAVQRHVPFSEQIPTI